MTLMTKEEYIESLRPMKKRIFLFGEEVKDYVDHPLIRPSINACGMTYELARLPEHEELMTAESSINGLWINRFTHLHQSADDLVKKVKVQRLLRQNTACCFQRCVGFDGLNAVDSVTYGDGPGAGYRLQQAVPRLPGPRAAARPFG